MTLSRVEQAARNNAIWCDTVCRVHGAAGEFHEAVWLNRNPVPRFYPNVITLANQRSVAAQLAHVQELVAALLPDTVVGLSNLFTPPADHGTFWAGCVATAQATFPGLPQVGHESGADLVRAEAVVGFDPNNVAALALYTTQSVLSAF